MRECVTHWPEENIMRKTALILAISCVASLALAAALAAQPAGGPVLDHFRCYSTLQVPVSTQPQVSLQDEFDLKLGILETVWVGPAIEFCNPVQKTLLATAGPPVVTPIADPNQHLTLYRIPAQTVEPPSVWNVGLANQFGRQLLWVRQPVVLGVPTEKVEDGLAFPAGLDHFECRLASGRILTRSVQLQDQFETATVVVLQPRLYCNPTQKVDAAGKVTAITNPAGHLTCYAIRLATPTGTTSSVERTIINQFTDAAGVPILAVTDEQLLCAPSQEIFARQVPGGPDNP